MPSPLQRVALLAVSAVIVLLLVTEAIRRGSIEPGARALPSFMSLRRHQLFLGPGAEAKLNPEGKVCPTCNCSLVGSFSSSPWAGNLPSVEHLWSRHATKTDFARYLSHHILLSAQAEPLPVPDTSRLRMLQNFVTCPDRLFSFSFNGLEMGRPTAYMFTRTGGKGRLGAAEKRLRYFRRHAATIQEFHELVEKEGYDDGAKGADKQLLWLIIEDDDHISPEIAEWLSSTGLPYIYVAHGPTRWYGLAQWNLAYSMVTFLRDTLLNDGPIVSVDDDGLIKPELLRRIWRVKKLIAWQVGNFARVDPSNSTWEGPFMENGKMIRWHNAWSWGPTRVFPLDMGGFAVNSAYLGPGRLIPGPRFIPEKPYDSVDTSNENEFLLQIYQRQEDMEFACWDNIKEKCYWTWHNHWLPEDIDETHLPALGPDFE